MKRVINVERREDVMQMIQSDRGLHGSFKLSTLLVRSFPNQVEAFIITMPRGVIDDMPGSDTREPLADSLTPVVADI